MNLPPNFNIFKEYLHYLQIISLKDYIKFYYLSINPNQTDWFYNDHYRRYYSTKRTPGDNPEFFSLIDLKYTTKFEETIKLTEEYVYNLLANVTQDQIKTALIYIEMKAPLKDWRYLTIQSKSGVEFTVLRKNFKRYCQFYEDFKEFSDKLGSTLILSIDFDQNVGNLVAKTINSKEFVKPVDFELMIKYIDLLRYLGVNF
jgi:hypothetical protein